jgi:hypothetical protein
MDQLLALSQMKIYNDQYSGVTKLLDVGRDIVGYSQTRPLINFIHKLITETPIQQQTL